MYPIKNIRPFFMFFVSVFVCFLSTQTYAQKQNMYATDTIPDPIPEELQPLYDFILTPSAFSDNKTYTYEYIGYNYGGEYYSGHLTQSGGNNMVQGLYLGMGGFGPYSYQKREGTYTLNDGYLQADGGIYIGWADLYNSGNFTQNGGGMYANTLKAGYQSVGYFVQNGGSNNLQNVYVSEGSHFTLNDGTSTVNYMVIGDNNDNEADGTGGGVLDLVGGTFTANTVKFTGTAGLNVENRDIDIKNDLIDGHLFNTAGATVTGWENTDITVDYASTITHDSETDFTAESIMFGSSTATPMTYQLNGDLTVKKSIYCWNFNGSTLNVNGSLDISHSEPGYYGADIYADILNLNTSLDATYRNYITVEDLNVDSATVDLANRTTVYANNSFSATNSTINAYANATAYLYNTADIANSQINLNNYGYLYSGEMRLGSDIGSTGTLNIGDRGYLYNRTSYGSGDMYVGYAESSIGHVVQNGSTNYAQVDGDLYIAHGADSTGTYDISSGRLNVDGELHVGYNGDGSFTQTGTAKVDVHKTMQDPETSETIPDPNLKVNIGSEANSTGSYILNPTTRGTSSNPDLNVSGEINVGKGTNSTGDLLNHNGYIKTETLNIATNDYTEGTVTMQSGAVLEAGQIHIGDQGTDTYEYEDNRGTLDLADDSVRVIVHDEIVFGRNSSFHAQEISTIGPFPEFHHIHLKGDDTKGAKMKIVYDGDYQPAGYDTAALSGLEKATLLVTGGTELDPCVIEAPGVNMGPIIPPGGWSGGGWSDGNYSFDKVYLGDVLTPTFFTLADSFDNQQEGSTGHEALYVNDLYISPFMMSSNILGDFVGRHIEFDSTNGDPEDSINLYWVRLWMWNWDYDPAEYDPDNPDPGYDPWTYVEPPTDGEWDPWNMPEPIPEPASLILLGTALLSFIRKTVKK